MQTTMELGKKCGVKKNIPTQLKKIVGFASRFTPSKAFFGASA